ncbi:DNA polymerase I [Blautia liquoris]|uniref:DNA polymerase I n=1 Tax=Blautia liquoris TaxID=2779518 RepID=A0A7M2RJL2_9FIRM|nr:DNA polymerase I [Blautia liquoris]QOV20449.1 DNA polymerase I [Blautia liquoris]
MSEKIVLIDGHSILNRAFYGVPNLSNSEGIHTNAVYGFLNILFKILEEEHPQYLTVAFDLNVPTFRHNRYAEYKGTRKPMPGELAEQVPLMKEVLKAMGVTIVTKEGYEADDILGTLAAKCETGGMEVTIVSGDRDLLQLATDHTMIRIPKTRFGQTTIEDYHAGDVVAKYQLLPYQIIELKALMGDASDNIPGIPGVGEKTATKILLEYQNIENAHEHVEDIRPNKAKNSLKEHYDMAKLSKELATICTDCPIDFDIESARMTNFYTPEAYEIFRRLDFKNLLTRFDEETAVSEKPLETEIIRNKDKLGKIIQSACDHGTVGISLIIQEKLWGIGISFGREEVYYAPVGDLLEEEYLKEKLDLLFSKCDIVSVLDLKEALKFTRAAKQKNVFDAQIAAYLINPLKAKYTYDDIAKEFAGEMLATVEDLFGKSKLPKLGTVSMDILAAYAGNMAYSVYCSRDPLEKMLKDLNMYELYTRIEIPLAFTLYDMEQAGMRVDAQSLKEYGDKLKLRIDELEQSIYQQAGEKFNINSPKQLGVVLFEKLQLPGGRKTKTGYSTAADILEKMAPSAPIVNDILEYRQMTKLKSTYADGLAGYIGADDRIHSTFNQTITATGRISSTEPNLQNIPIRMELGKMIRKVFIPKDGCLFIDADYSQIELRVLASLSADENLIEAYREEKDIHRMTASKVFHVPFGEVTPLQRRNAKAVNFGIVYGISSFGLSQDLNISRKEASQYIEDYFKNYPKIKEFLDEKVKTAKEDGYVTTKFGRRRPIPELKSSNFMQRSFGERVAMNAPIQGTAADIIKIAMIRVNERLKNEGYKSKLLLQVHDELLIEAPETEVKDVSALLKEEMTGAADLAVALEVDMHTGKDWYDAH